MKTGNYITMKELRDRQFYRDVTRVLNKARRRGASLTVGQAVERAIKDRADGYFVSVDHARHMLCRMHCGRVSANCSPLQLLKWREFDSKVRERCRLTGCSRLSAIVHVLTYATASRYFIAPSTGIRIYNQYQKRERI